MNAELHLLRRRLCCLETLLMLFVFQSTDCRQEKQCWRNHKTISRTNDLTLLFKLLASFQQSDVDVEYCHSWQPVTQPVWLFLWGPRDLNCFLDRWLDLFICTEHVSNIKYKNSFCVVVHLLCWPPVATCYVLCAPSSNEFSPGILLWSRSHSVL